MAARTDVTVVVTAKDLATGTLKGVGKAASNLGLSFDQAKIASFALAGAIGLIGKSAIGSAAEMEQNRVAFETMLGSADKARVLMKQLSDTARTTPFELPNIVNAARQLLAYGSSAEDIIPEVRMLGDISGGNAERFQQLSLAFGQVRAKTRLAGQEMLQFTNAGVGLREELSKRLGVSIADVDKKMEDGKITFNDVKGVLKSMTSEGGKFFGLMDKQSKTFSGRLSNINDNFGRMLRGIVGINEAGDIREGSIFAVLSDAAETFLGVLDRLTPAIIGFADGLSRNPGQIALIAGAIAGALTPAIITLVATIGSALIGIAPFVLLGMAIGKAWVENWGGIQQKVGEVISYFQTNAIPIISGMFQTFVKGSEMVAKAIDEFWKLAKPTVDSIIKSWQSIADSLIKIFGGDTSNDIMKLGEAITKGMGGIALGVLFMYDIVLKSIASAIKTNIPLFKDFIKIVSTVVDVLSKLVELSKKIPNFDKAFATAFKATVKSTIPGAGALAGFQTGGIIPGPVGEPRTVLAHGGEEIRPTGVGGRTGSGMGFNVTVNVGTMIASDTERRNFAELLMRDLENIASMKGKKLNIV